MLWFAHTFVSWTLLTPKKIAGTAAHPIGFYDPFQRSAVPAGLRLQAARGLSSNNSASAFPHWCSAPAGHRNAAEAIYTLVRIIVIFPSQKYVAIHRGQANERQALLCERNRGFSTEVFVLKCTIWVFTRLHLKARHFPCDITFTFPFQLLGSSTCTQREKDL